MKTLALSSSSSFPALLAIVILLAVSVQTATSSSSSPSVLRFIVKNEIFMGRRVPEFCFDYFESSSSKLKLNNIARDVITDALESEHNWSEQEEYYRLQNGIQSLAERQNPEHICDAAEFAPTVLSADYQYTCVEICQSCMPGSAPICYQRSPRYPALAQVCLCTYDTEKPVENAALSLRHEKRVFSRKIRRT